MKNLGKILFISAIALFCVSIFAACNEGITKLDKPTAAVTQYTYDGTEKVLGITGFLSDKMNVEGNTATEVGNYVCTITIKDTTQYAWKTTGDVVINWSIVADETDPWTDLNAADVFTDYYGGYFEPITGGVRLFTYLDEEDPGDPPDEVGWSARWSVTQNLDSFKFNLTADLQAGESFVFIMSFKNAANGYADEVQFGIGMKNGQLYVNASKPGILHWESAEDTLNSIAEGKSIDSFNEVEFIFSADYLSVTIKVGGQTFELTNLETVTGLGSLWMTGTTESVDFTNLKIK